jgi:hypothetical protein
MQINRNSIAKLSLSGKNMTGTGMKNMTVLVQNQTTKSSAPFLKNLPKVRPQIFPGPRNLFRPLLCFAAEISAPWQHCLILDFLLHEVYTNSTFAVLVSYDLV